MTDNIRNSSDQGRRYRSQLVKIVEVNARGVLRQSPGVNGYGNGRTGLIIFCDGYTGETKNLTSIPEGCAFLPISGYRSEAEINGLNQYGYCWSSTPVGGTQAYCLNFRESVKTSVNNNRNYGFPVRLVVDVTE